MLFFSHLHIFVNCSVCVHKITESELDQVNYETSLLVEIYSRYSTGFGNSAFSIEQCT